jgi:hypothetical protein
MTPAGKLTPVYNFCSVILPVWALDQGIKKYRTISAASLAAEIVHEDSRAAIAVTLGDVATIRRGPVKVAAACLDQVLE